MYFTRFCLHNYSDDDAVKILQNIIPAMKHGAKLVMMDTVLPEPNTVGQSQERLQCILDLQIVDFFVRAKEREIDDWKRIFKD